ncbi:MAG: LysR substrate-binding domain-containing protein [Planctomycetota bacterium]|nr:LysR substrate-binding domain-containing protein [Planctomycetota bacterium]
MPIDITAVTLAELRYVVALSDHRHFGRAARASLVTQPTLSAAIKKVETTLRVTIFERSSKLVAVTPLGAQIVEEARRVLDAMDRIGDIAAHSRDPLAGPLRLGVIPTLGPYLLPWLIPPLHAAFPRLQLILRELKTSDMVEELTHNQLDAGILALPLPIPGLASSALFEEPFLFVAPTGHALSKKASVKETDLEGERVLLLDEGHCLRDQALSFCRKSGATTYDREGDFRATSIETLRHMVGAGMGSTLLPALAVTADEESRSHVMVRHFVSPEPGRKMALAWRKTHPRAADHQKLAEFVRANVPDTVKALAKK